MKKVTIFVTYSVSSMRHMNFCMNAAMQPIEPVMGENKDTLLKKIIVNRGIARLSDWISRRKSIVLSGTIDFFLQNQTLFAHHAKISHLTLFSFSFFLSPTVDRTGCTFHFLSFFLASGRMSISGTWMALRFKDLWKKKNRKLNPVNDD